MGAFKTSVSATVMRAIKVKYKDCGITGRPPNRASELAHTHRNRAVWVRAGPPGNQSILMMKNYHSDALFIILWENLSDYRRRGAVARTKPVAHI